MPDAIASLIDDLRSRGGFKSFDVANITGVSPATISCWAAGKTTPHPKTQLLIAHLHHVVARLAELHAPEEVRYWLFAGHRLWQGKRPIDLIHAGRADAVLGIIESASEAAYI
jgi:transcriptional regulator with XRE-family HTH domain